MAKYIAPTLSKLFMLDPRRGQKEGTEHEKILYFWPDNTPLATKQSDVGLSEALVNFTKTFSPDKPCEAVHLEKTRQTFFQCEPDIWMVMVATNPHTVKVKDGETIKDYDGDAFSDANLRRVIYQAYHLYKLFNGPCEEILKKKGVEELRRKLACFFNRYVPCIDFNKVDLFSALDGIHFLPVDKNVYLRIQSFINWTENNFPAIQYSCFLYRDHLVWSALEQDDMRIMYKYLVEFVLPNRKRMKAARKRQEEKGKEKEKEKEKDKEKDRERERESQPLVWPTLADGRYDESVVFLLGHAEAPFDGFVTGPKDINQTNTEIYTPLTYVGPKNDMYHLIIYQLQEITCLFLVKYDATSVQDNTFYVNLQKFIAPELGFLAPVLADHWLRKQGYADEYRYIYFNHMNLALKTSIKRKGLVISKEYMKILNDMHTDFEKSGENISELMVRTQDDGWIVGRKSDQREFYVIFEQKNANLLEVNEEVRKLSSTYFNNIFIE